MTLRTLTLQTLHRNSQPATQSTSPVPTVAPILLEQPANPSPVHDIAAEQPNALESTTPIAIPAGQPTSQATGPLEDSPSTTIMKDIFAQYGLQNTPPDLATTHDTADDDESDGTTDNKSNFINGSTNRTSENQEEEEENTETMA